MFKSRFSNEWKPTVNKWKPTPYNFVKPKKKKKKIQSNFRIPVRGPKLWNEIFSNFEKELTNTLLLKNRVNEIMLKLNILLENILS